MLVYTCSASKEAMSAKPVHTLSEYSGGLLGTVVAFIDVQVLVVLSLLCGC